jgi:hypothetical protein
VYEKNLHLAAFDTLAGQLTRSIVLAATLVEQELRSPLPPPRVSAKSLLEATLERYTDIYRRSTYETLPLGQLLSSALHAEAYLAYEHRAHAQRMERAGRAVEAQALHDSGQQHHDSVGGLIETALRAHNLNVVPRHPYIMPYRGVFLSPYSQELLDGLMSGRDYFARWRDGVVAAIPEDQIERYRSLAPQAVILYLDADALGEEMMRAQMAGATTFEASFAHRLQYAENISPARVGEDFAAYASRLLLKQNALLRSVRGRLGDEQHTVAALHCSPLLDGNTRQLQAALAALPESRSTDRMAELEALENSIASHAASWAEHGRAQDSAGLLYQFDGAARSSSVSAQLKTLRQVGSG